jgi:glutamate synthase domain-containing protein 2/glutamate synthase domain-containing protein 1/glutamate synthase domain-containing protein 3
LYDPANEHDSCGIGFVAHLRGERSHAVVRDALVLLDNLSHRSATAGGNGDGAGILLQLPHAFLRAAAHDLGIALPELGAYGVGMFFLPRDESARGEAIARVGAIVAERGWRVLGWRDVPVDEESLTPAAREARPSIHQCFVAPAALEREADDPSAIERTLFVIRRAIERDALGARDGRPSWYVASLSSRTIVYKGRLRPDQLARFYPDLADWRVVSGLALVHSRFSTNTFPSWPLAHPYRLVCHNGEINTLRGNVSWMRAREAELASARFDGGVDELLPIVQPAQSDSASLDNVLELLVHSGRPIAQAMAMLVPEAWERDDNMPADRRAFYEYHSALMEPWDGPAAIAFTDGRHVGAVQDRNGLRPARWIVTDDDLVVLASEAGAFAVPPSRVREKGRLQPGRMLLVNTTQGRVLHDDEIKSELSSVRPYRRWLNDQQLDLETEIGRVAKSSDGMTNDALRRAQRAFGYTREELAMILEPMAANGEEAIGSMGNDTPFAVLSERPQLLYSYFRQSFAQVTNPPIDPIREQLVMSLGMRLGPQRNVLDETPEHARQIVVEHPILTARGIAALRGINESGLTAVTLPALFDSGAPTHLERDLDALCDAALAAANAGHGVLILSDRGADRDRAPIPSLLAVAAVHHHLIRAGCRARVSIVAESGDAREVSHIALLFAYGASAVHPYVALATAATFDGAKHYVKAVEKGLLKILSKMGISTLRSYTGAQIWEAVGLDRAMIERYFSGTASRIGGIGLESIAADVSRRRAACDDETLLDAGGEYHYRIQGEHHNWSPRVIAMLQRATRENLATTFREFTRLADDAHRDHTLRGLLEFTEREAVPLKEVEPATSIVRRFATGAMSFGSISAEAHETLAVAMNRIGGRSNTGEGGEDPARFGTERNSAIKQVASARFGVTAEYLVNADELQIKIAQGAKPGEGGQLPGHKVDEMIAKTRHSTAGVTLISPPPHHDIYSIEDLKQLVYDLRCVNPSATISVKLVAESGVGTVAAGVVKADADLVVISGDSGGTGASPLSSIKRAGVPWELGLAETQQTLVLNDLRGRVRLQADGQLKTGRDVVIAALLGADEFGFATAPLIVEGCVMMRKCHLNTCPVGIATQDPVLRAKFAGRAEHVVNYFFFVAEEVRELMASLGFRTFDEMVGRTDVLRQRADIASPKARTLDLGPLLHAANLLGEDRARRHTGKGSSAAVATLDASLLALVSPALERGEPVGASAPVRNVQRAIGAAISGEIARRHGAAGLEPDTIALRLVGSAGQSFGAFAARGLTLELEGEANDYVGKGLSGGRLIVRPPKEARVLPDATVIVGNTALYGATSGEAFIGGAAGERFAVRNSGATVVVEGVGDHGCEYMTGGVVVVLGSVGRNFGAGMSGGIAYVLDETGAFRERVASPSFEVSAVSDIDDRQDVRTLLERHVRYTGSRRARHLLSNWNEAARRLVRVMPVEYKRAIEVARAKASESEAARYG